MVALISTLMRCNCDMIKDDRGEVNARFANNVFLQNMNSRSKSSGKSSKVKGISGHINSQFHFSGGRIIGLTGSLMDQ